MEVQHMGTDREATEKELDDDSLLKELSNLARGDCDNSAKERDPSVLEVQHIGTDRDATEGNLEDNALLEAQLKKRLGQPRK
jgi:hypothetical protein